MPLLSRSQFELHKECDERKRKYDSGVAIALIQEMLNERISLACREMDQIRRYFRLKGEQRIEFFENEGGLVFLKSLLVDGFIENNEQRDHDIESFLVQLMMLTNMGLSNVKLGRVYRLTSGIPKAVLARTSAFIARWMQGRIDLRAFEVLSHQMIYHHLHEAINDTTFDMNLRDKQVHQLVERRRADLDRIIDAVISGEAASDSGMITLYIRVCDANCALGLGTYAGLHPYDMQLAYYDRDHAYRGDAASTDHEKSAELARVFSQVCEEIERGVAQHPDHDLWRSLGLAIEAYQSIQTHQVSALIELNTCTLFIQNRLARGGQSKVLVEDIADPVALLERVMVRSRDHAKYETIMVIEQTLAAYEQADRDDFGSLLGLCRHEQVMGSRLPA